MRTKLARTVREDFRRAMALKFTFFERITADDVISTGNCLYRWRMDHGLFSFVHLQFHHRKDAFTINVVARSGDENCCTPRADRKLAPSNIVRIHKLWGQPRDFWLMLPDEPDDPRLSFQRLKEPVTDEQVASFRKLVDDAVQLIDKYAIPYFKGEASPFTQNHGPEKDLKPS